jgi:hypothetical protein
MAHDSSEWMNNEMQMVGEDQMQELLKGFVEDPNDFLTEVRKFHHDSGGILVIQHQDKVMWEETLDEMTSCDTSAGENQLNGYLTDKEGYKVSLERNNDVFAASWYTWTKEDEAKVILVLQKGRARYRDPRAAVRLIMNELGCSKMLKVFMWPLEKGAEDDGKTGLSEDGLYSLPSDRR